MTQEATALTNGLTQRVSAEIRAELARQQMSQRRLAELLGMDPALVSKRLNGGIARSFTLAEVDEIASALGVPVSRLFGAGATGVVG
jgi:transcriptional regulator with XRE-family HTH domain